MRQAHLFFLDCPRVLLIVGDCIAWVVYHTPEIPLWVLGIVGDTLSEKIIEWNLAIWNSIFFFLFLYEDSYLLPRSILEEWLYILGDGIIFIFVFIHYIWMIDLDLCCFSGIILLSSIYSIHSFWHSFWLSGGAIWEHIVFTYCLIWFISSIRMFSHTGYFIDSFLQISLWIVYTICSDCLSQSVGLRVGSGWFANAIASVISLNIENVKNIYYPFFAHCPILIAFQYIHQKRRTHRNIHHFSSTPAHSYVIHSSNILSASVRVRYSHSLFPIWYFTLSEYIASCRT